jgi:hypothetical protein
MLFAAVHESAIDPKRTFTSEGIPTPARYANLSG